MASFGYHTLSSNDYDLLKSTILYNAEGYSVLPYLDTAAAKNPTIGIGFNLRIDNVLTQVLLKIFYPGDTRTSFLPTDNDKYKILIANAVNANYTTSQALQSALNAIMAQRAADSSVSYNNKQTVFSFASGDDAKKVLIAIAPTYETALNNALAPLNLVPNSSERAALFSLAYNNPALIGSKLKAAIQAGNRAAAWFEIRYDSNGDGQNARRRYYESEEFGLYNPGTLDDPESRQIFQMVTQNWAAISAYDVQYQSDFNKAVGFGVETLDQATAQAKNFLVSEYGGWQPTDRVWVASSSLETLDFSLRTGNDLFVADDNGDVIKAGSGNDVLHGGAGNDTFYVGAGTDLLVGGGGGDTFQLGASANRTASDNVVITTQAGSPTTSTVNGYQGTDNVYIDNNLYRVGYQDSSGAYSMNGNQVTVGANGITISLPDQSTVNINGTIQQDNNNVYVGGQNGIVLHKNPAAAGSTATLTFSTTVTLPGWVAFLVTQYNAAFNVASPLVLDLVGTGLHLTALNGTVANGGVVAPVYFDMENSGFGIATGWIGSGSGLLAMDVNGNGKIDNQSELFGNQSGAQGSDGFSSLAKLDSNHDGQITAADTNFNKLRVWVDSNQDGISQPGELFTLAQLGITSINLNDSQVNQTIAGNQIKEQSTFTINGKTQTIADVWFADDPVNSVYHGSYTLNPQALLLPQLRGYGLLPNLAIAMSQNAALMTAVQQFTTFDVLGNPSGISGVVKEIMYLWAGVQNVDPGSRGGSAGGFDARDIGFAEAFFDKSASEIGTIPNFVGSGRGQAIEHIVGQIEEQLTARLLFQSVGQQFFSTLPIYNSATDTFTGGYVLNMNAIKSAMRGKSLTYVVQQWVNIFTMIDGSFGLANITPADQSALTTAIAASDPSGTLTYNALYHIVTANILNGANFIFGTSGNDTFNLTSSNNIVLGMGGNDTFNPGLSSGAQQMYGGSGNDKFNSLSLAAGSVIDGGGGTNVLQTFGDLSSLSISNIQELDVIISTIVTAAQMAEFSNIVNGSNDGSTIYAATSGVYDLTQKNVTGIFNLQGSQTGDEILKGNALTQTITAGGGNDWLYAGTGNETLTAGSGNDLIYGNVGNDIFNAYSGGLDQIYGGTGNDTFNIGNLAAGSIIDGGGGTNVLKTGTDISKLKISNIQELDTDGSITLTSAELAGFSKVVDISSYGSSIHAASAGIYDLINNKTLMGTISLYGSSGDDLLASPGGLDSLYGGAGNDLLDMVGVFKAGAVLDGGTGTNTLRAYNWADISAATVQNVTQLVINGGVNLTAAQLNGFSSVSNMNVGTAGSVTWMDAVGTGTFDLTKKNVTGVINLQGSATGNDILKGNAATQMITAGGGNDWLYAGVGNETLIAGSGNDLIYGNSGNDTFNANLGGLAQIYGGTGNDTFNIGSMAAGSIIDGGGGNNVLKTGVDISKLNVSNFQELDINRNVTLTAAELAGFSKVVDASGGGSTISAAGAGTYDLTKKNVTGIINLQGSASGDDILKGNALTQTITAGGGNDWLYAGVGNETLIAGSGNDLIYGNSGNDTFWAAYGGLQQIYGGTGNDTFYVGNLSAGSIIDGGGGTNVLKTGADLSRMSVSNFQELDVELQQTTLTAKQFAEFSKIVDGSGAGSWIYASGAGTYDLTRKNVTGIINLQGTGTGDQVLIGNANTQSITAGTGNDTLSGSGAHILQGGAGNDTFLMGMAPAFAGEVIDGGGGNNTLMSSHADLTQAKITNLQNLQINGGVTLTAAQLAAFNQVTDIQVGPGGSWVIASGSGTYDVSKATGYINIWGGSGNNTLIGNGAAETFYTNAGNDTVDGGGGGSNPYGGDLFYGGSGNDTYLFARGYGTNAINQLNTGATGDVVQLKSGVARDQLWFSQNGNDLLVQIIGTNDKMTIDGWYNGSTNDQVGQIQTSDGHLLTNTKVQNLVNAMASLTLPATTTLSPDYQTKLEPVIAANWS